MNLETLYVSGVIVNIAIAFTVVELAALWMFHRLTGRGLPAEEYLLNGLSGLSLMLSLRAALSEVWVLMALGLIAAGAVHLADLYQRSTRISQRNANRDTASGLWRRIERLR
jgi:hypothetical protein